MEYITVIGLPIIIGVITPIFMEFLRKKLHERREDRQDALENEKHDDQMASALREELREENRSLKEENLRLKKSAVDHYDIIQESKKWEESYYLMRKEKDRLSFELALLQKELELVREQHEDYLKIRKWAERHLGGQDDR